MFTLGRQQRGSGLCRLLNTSSMNCWDGNQVVTDDIDDFEEDDILSQGVLTLLNLSLLKQNVIMKHSLTAPQLTTL